ncbi:MAG: hypothetical protein QOJ71_1570 [Actinomycetota bacterium]|jgi:hypothetical protein|nr:hypothetical protein [Actinomycetota bacterium]
MSDSKKHQAGELSLQEAADPLDVHYVLADPLRHRNRHFRLVRHHARELVNSVS